MRAKSLAGPDCGIVAAIATSDIKLGKKVRKRHWERIFAASEQRMIRVRNS
jgi:hypothetical protein